MLHVSKHTDNTVVFELVPESFTYFPFPSVSSPQSCQVASPENTPQNLFMMQLGVKIYLM